MSAHGEGALILCELWWWEVLRELPETFVHDSHRTSQRIITLRVEYLGYVCVRYVI